MGYMEWRIEYMQKNDAIKRIKIINVFIMVILSICEIGVIAAGVKGYMDFRAAYSDTVDIGIGVSFLYFLPFLFPFVAIIILMIITNKVSAKRIKKYQDSAQND